MIYANQMDYYKRLSMNAANPYVVIQTILPNSFDVGVKVGLVLAVVVALALVAAFVRRGREPSRDRLLMMATLSLTVMPYVLPEMHERYFFPASAMAFLLAVARPRAWPVVVLIQFADLCAYTQFLLLAPPIWLNVGIVIITCAIGLLIWMFAQKPDTAPKGGRVQALATRQ